MDKEYLIQKWLTDDLTDQEMEALKQEEDYSQLIGIIYNAKYFRAEGFSKIDDFSTFSMRLKNTAKPVGTLTRIKPFLRIASVLFIGLMLSYFMLFNGNVEVQTLAGEKTTIELPDASKVMMNALSEIKYSKRTWDNKRELQLQGEAYFKVAKGAKFDVLTSAGTVTVVGTQFNVKQREGYFEVACFEGTVKVTSGEVSQALKAGDRLRFSQDTHSLGKTTDQFPQWTNNISSFERVPLAQVFTELERQYNVKVISKNKDRDLLFTGGFTHSGLENALKSICEPLDLIFLMDKDNTVTILDKK